MAKGDRKLGQARSKASLQRKVGTRSVNKKILIVCQGAETEHQYFSQLRSDLKLVSTHVDIPDDAHGYSAARMLSFAKRKMKREVKRGDGFDKVFLVFDKDADESFQDTLNNIDCNKPKGVVEGCYSIPCFEYWLLLHFEYSRKPFNFKDGSWSKELCDEISKHIPNYNKSGTQAYKKTKAYLDRAVRRSKISLADVDKTGEDNPSTTVYKLFEYILEQR